MGTKRTSAGLPQLRLRSEYSYGQAYGACEQVAAAAHAVGASGAGLVDS